MVAEIAQRFAEVQTTTCAEFDALPEVLAEVKPHALYTVRFRPGPYPRDAIFAEGGPRWVANGGVGIDHFGNWDPTRVTVTNAAGVAADMMAEYVLGGFLHFTLDIPGLLADKAAMRWDVTRTVRPLAGQTLLIVGLGHTGRSLAARAKALGMNVIGTRARPCEMENVDEVAAASDLHALLPRADFIAVCTPLTPATRGLIGVAELALVKPGAILADVSRGGVVDQTDPDALTRGALGAAILDVFETEPLPAESPLWDAGTVADLSALFRRPRGLGRRRLRHLPRQPRPLPARRTASQRRRSGARVLRHAAHRHRRVPARDQQLRTSIAGRVPDGIRRAGPSTVSDSTSTAPLTRPECHTVACVSVSGWVRAVRQIASATRWRLKRPINV
jgi:phosphoglycerate dehydrogenase-like enzyme